MSGEGVCLGSFCPRTKAISADCFHDTRVFDSVQLTMEAL